MNTLADAAAGFAGIYNAQDKLVEEQRGWSRVIALVSTDTEEAVSIHVVNGRIAEVRGGDSGADVVVASENAVLRDILESRRSPNEPYMFGELTVRGPEADFLRLDYITTMLCPN